eukprot:777724-Amphidinium_carterae.1
MDEVSGLAHLSAKRHDEFGACDKYLVTTACLLRQPGGLGDRTHQAASLNIINILMCRCQSVDCLCWSLFSIILCACCFWLDDG